MIRNISIVNFSPVFQNSATFESKKNENVEPTVKFEDLNGLDAQAIYMSVSVAQKSPVKVLDIPNVPIIRKDPSIKNLHGEKVYNSHDELISVVEKENNKKIVYTPLKGALDKIQKIEVYENDSSQPTLVQENSYRGLGDLCAYEVEKIDSANKTTLETVYYANEDVMYGSKTVKTEDYTKEVRIYEDKTHTVTISSNDDKEVKYIKFNKDLKPEKVSVDKYNDTSNVVKTIHFYNGIPYSVETSSRVLNRNLTANNLIEDLVVLLPTKSIGDTDVLVSSMLSNPEAERKHYTNGTLEAVILKDTAIKFDIDGNLNKIIYPDKTVTIDNYSETIEENNDGIIKTTTYNDNGTCDVTLIDGDFVRDISYDDNGTVRFYMESKNEEYLKSLSFNESGILKYASEG